MAESVVKLRVDDKEYNASLRNAKQGLIALEQSLQNAGKSFLDVDHKVVDYIRELGKMGTQSTTAKGKIGEMTSAFTEWGMAYKRMTDQEKSSPAGKALAQSLDQLKTRVVQAKADLADLNKSLNDTGKEMESAAGGGVDFGAVLSQLGSQLGINSQLMQALSTGTVATTAAIAAGAVAAGAAAKAWSDYNDELGRQNTMTSVVTGGKGGEDLTMGVRALARTYDVDFRQAIEAANTLMQQFGVSSSEALRLLQDGMQGLIAGDGGKLLSMIQQYAPSFRDAGIEASQLVAIIQNSEGGIFTDQNMSAISMGIKNIRLMTKQTSEALAQLGIDGEEMTRKLNDGSMTIFEALRQVAGAIENTGSSSQAAGQVMQQVFGRQGSMAGTKLGEAIATLNTNLEETKKQTGELGESFVRLNEANMRLERTMQEIFGMTGWEDMSNTIKTQFAESLSDALQYLIDVRDALKDIGSYDSFDTLSDAALRFVPALWPLLQGLQEMTGLLNDIESAWNSITGNTSSGGGGFFSGKGKSITQTISNLNVPRNVLPEVVVTSGGKKVVSGGNNKPNGGGTKSGTAWAPIAMGDFEGIGFGRSVKDVQADLSRAQGIYNVAEDESSRAAAKKMVEAYHKELETMKNEGDVTKGGFADAYNHDFGKEIDRLSKELKKDGKENQATGMEQVKQMSAMVGGIQQMISGIELLGIEIPDGFQSILGGMQGIITILEAIQTVNTVGTALGLFSGGGIVPHAANGYFVPGTHYSGDVTPIMANAGELVLSRSQQSTLAAQLQHTEQGGGYGGTPYVDGEKIFLGMNNFLRRSGKGEIVTSRR